MRFNTADSGTTWTTPELRTLRVSLDTFELGGSNSDASTGTTTTPR